MRQASWSCSVLGTILVCSKPPASPDPRWLWPQRLPFLQFGAHFLYGFRVAAFAGGPEECAVPEIRMVFTQCKRPEQQLVGLQGRPDAESFN